MKRIHKVAILGAGTMGARIAAHFANAGIPSYLLDIVPPDADVPARNKIAAAGLDAAKKSKPAAFMDASLARLVTVSNFEDDLRKLADVDWIIEAVVENLDIKRQVFGELDKICKPGAIMASNTSTLNIDEIASVTSRPEFVIGHHYFSPANVMRLLEIVRGKATSKEVIATSMALAKRLKKVGVLVGNCRGFVGNRMLAPYRREAEFLIEEGAAPQDVDGALYKFGLAMGPIAMGDLAGLDVGWRIRKEYKHLEDPTVRHPMVGDRLCEMGRFGQKTGAGWYRYDENRKPIPDAEVYKLIEQASAEVGIQRREISEQEIVERTMYALVNEGAKILEEGYALRAVDIDIIYINGYGFPAWRGGPMWFADTVGVKNVYDRISKFHAEHGKLWEPAPLLKTLAEQGRTFADFDKGRITAAA